MTLKDIKSDLKRTNQDLDKLTDAVLADSEQKDPGLVEAMTQLLFRYRRIAANLGNYENEVTHEELHFYRELFDEESE